VRGYEKGDMVGWIWGWGRKRREADAEVCGCLGVIERASGILELSSDEC
jgi:hypothetical protein